VSYILDALTKAAQQRDRQVPVVQRLLSPAPRPRAPWRNTSGRLLAALAVNAVLLTAVLIWWLRPASVGTTEPIVAAPPEPVAASVPPPAPPAASARTLVKLEPLPSAAIKTEKQAPSTPEPRAETVVAPPRSGESQSAASQAVAPPAPAAPVAVAPPPAPPRQRSGTPTIQATKPPPPAPSTAARAPAPPEAAGLKLEALIYAEAPAERMVFINGRRYREGDSIDGGRLKVEEIREDSVELSDQGRRFALRVAR
jgi:general secretion pathway protein B